MGLGDEIFATAKAAQDAWMAGFEADKTAREIPIASAPTTPFANHREALEAALSYIRTSLIFHRRCRLYKEGGYERDKMAETVQLCLLDYTRSVDGGDAEPLLSLPEIIEIVRQEAAKLEGKST